MANLETAIPHPLTTLRCHRGAPEHGQIARLIDRWQPQTIVVGRPADDSPPALLDGISRFSAYLKKQFDLPVVATDEAYSSCEAKSILKRQRQNKLRDKIEKADIDKIAACLILESWLHSARRKKNR